MQDIFQVAKTKDQIICKVLLESCRGFRIALFGLCGLHCTSPLTLHFTKLLTVEFVEGNEKSVQDWRYGLEGGAVVYTG